MRSTLRFVAATLALVLLAACGSAENAANPNRSGTSTPIPGGVLRVAIAADPDNLNTLIRRTGESSAVMGICQRGLAEYTTQKQWVPALADHWTWSDDTLTLTFHLRRDAKWSDGALFTSQDVVTSYHLTKDPRIASPRRAELNNVTDVVAVDDFTVEFHFAQRSPQQLFNANSLGLVPHHVVGDLAVEDVATWPINRRPRTVGPFRVARWDPGERVVVERDPNYYGPAPYLDQIIFEIVPEESVRLLKLETGEIDLVDKFPAREARRFRETLGESIKIYTLQGRDYGYLTYNTTRPMFADKRVRQAISYAIDRRALIEGLLFGQGDRLATSIPPMLGDPHHSGLTPHERDVDRSRALLREAGWIDADGDGILDKDGVRFSFEMKTKLGDSVREHGAVIIQQNLREVGIEVRPIIQEMASVMPTVRKKDYDVYYGHFGTRMEVDPTSQFGTGGSNNHAAYSNPELDDMISTALTTLDPDQANRLWHQVQEVLHEDQPWSYLYLMYPSVAIHQKFQDCTPHALSALEGVETWWMLPDQP